MKLIKKLDIRSKSGIGRRYGLFFCPRCGENVERVLSDSIKYKTCGCLHRERKHKMFGTKIYGVWQGMKNRCRNKNAINYNLYGERGITVFKEWEEFTQFYDWATKNGYKDGLQIDRIDNECGYLPENCRFVTPAENSRNRRNNKLNYDNVLKIRGAYYKGNISQRDLAKKYNVSQSLIWNVVNNKMWA